MSCRSVARPAAGQGHVRPHRFVAGKCCSARFSARRIPSPRSSACTTWEFSCTRTWRAPLAGTQVKRHNVGVRTVGRPHLEQALQVGKHDEETISGQNMFVWRRSEWLGGSNTRGIGSLEYFGFLSVC